MALNKYSLPFLLLTSVASVALRAEVRLPSLFGDHMVVQEEAPIPVWGTADPGEKVAVAFAGRSAETVAGPDGKWRIDLDAVPVGTAPAEMTVTGKATVTFHDVLPGEVWLCSGQSNMELALRSCSNASTEAARANDPSLRLFVVEKKLSLQPLAELEGSWQLCTPETALDFSGAGYFFGRRLRAALNRPVGLIGSYWGGSTAQAWTSLSGMQDNPPLQRYIDLYRTNADRFPQLNDHYEEKLEAYQEAAKAWQTPENVAAEKAWLARLRDARAAHQPDPPRDFPPKPQQPPTPGGDQKGPANLYDGMISPLIPYALKGVIWYQGEYNTDDPMEYYVLFPRLIADWRHKWGRDDLPFLFVQLPALFNAADPGSHPAAAPDSWDIVREAQARALSLPHTGMAVALDVGGGLHPPDKLDVGERLAAVARREVYGEAGLPASGPALEAARTEGSRIRLLFRKETGAPVLGASPFPACAAAQPKDRLAGFLIAGADKAWREAEARIDGDTVIVSSPVVPEPVAVRYGWGNGPYDAACNLYNAQGLPAAPFRTDAWDDMVPQNARLQGRLFPSDFP